MSKKVAILGAGITGLACAWKLAQAGFDVEIIEKEPRIGGLASSVNLNGYPFDYGPHAFHTQDTGLLKIFKEIVGDDNIITQKKWVKIKFRSKYFDYPLKAQDVFFRLNPLLALKCLFDFIYVSLAGKFNKKKEISSRDWLINRYGKGIYGIFFGPYTEKVWGISADRLCASFIAYRAPTINLGEIILKAVFGISKKFTPCSIHEVPPDLLIYYPKNGSITFPNAIWEKIKAKAGKVTLNSIIENIKLRDNKVSSIVFIKDEIRTELNCDYLVSTIPISELVPLISDSCDNRLLKAAGGLRYRALVLGCLVINKEKVFAPQTIYFTNRIFNRMAQMNSYDPNIFPKEKAGLIAEITCDKNDKIWNMPDDELLQLVDSDLQKELLVSRDDIEAQFLLRNPYGYPILEVGYQDKLNVLKEYFFKIDNLLTGGRQGSFNYIQMNFAFMSGLKMADYIIKGATKKEVDSSIYDLRYYF